MIEKKRIVDTTLRDGEQSAGIALTEQDKIELAIMLDELGVYEIEAGIPIMQTESKDYISEIKKVCKFSKISVWSRMNPEDVKQAILCKPDIIHIGAPVSYVQIYGKLNKNKTWVQKVLSECIDIAIAGGIEVTVGFEDASRSDEGFMINTAIMIEKLGVKSVRVADTVGILTPHRSAELVKKLRSQVGLNIEFHAHNDLGMAIANSIASAKAGAEYIDCTLLGIGERSGNCDLFKFLYATERIFDCGIDKREVVAVENALKKKCINI